MQHYVRTENGAVVIGFEGEIDLECSAEVRDLLLHSLTQGSDVLVDMSGVALIDSSGVASLLEAFQNARKKGKSFTLAGVGNSVMRVFKLARLETVFIFSKSVESVLGSR